MNFVADHERSDSARAQYEYWKSMNHTSDPKINGRARLDLPGVRSLFLWWHCWDEFLAVGMTTWDITNSATKKFLEEWASKSYELVEESLKREGVYSFHSLRVASPASRRSARARGGGSDSISTWIEVVGSQTIAGERRIASACETLGVTLEGSSVLEDNGIHVRPATDSA